jgi:hypothetical protein
MGQHMINFILLAKAKHVERCNQRRKFYLPFFKVQKNHFIGRYPAHGPSIKTTLQNDDDLTELITVKGFQVLITGDEQAMLIVPHLQQSFFGHIGLSTWRIASRERGITEVMGMRLLLFYLAPGGLKMYARDFFSVA